MTSCDDSGFYAPPRGEPMPVKYWSAAGLMLTDWCNAACACCYANCSPSLNQWLPVADALKIWADLIEAGRHGCRVHLTGGEAFGRFDHLLEVCRQGRQLGLGPLEAVETNGFWADDADTVRQRLQALDAAGLGRIAVSTDPYHQQFVPIRRVRLLVRIAEEILGPDRVRVRWRDWLDNGFDTGDLTQEELRKTLTCYAQEGRDRFTGRGADGLDDEMMLKPAEDFDDKPCNERLLRGRHVHIAPTGEVWPATCVGIVVGNALTTSIKQIWRRLYTDWSVMPVVAGLSTRGPVALLDQARQVGFVPAERGYASKCQLCFHLRRHLHSRGQWREYLGPAQVYAAGADRTAKP